MLGKYVVVRTQLAGAHAGTLQMLEGTTATLKDARRLWYWDGAASLSQLAVDGVSKPQNCKFPVEVPSIYLTGVCEVIPASEKAVESIKQVPIWAA